jgi:hypothetical protein
VSQLLGYPCLVLETVGRCHYLCFATEPLLVLFRHGLDQAVAMRSAARGGHGGGSLVAAALDEDGLADVEVALDPRQAFILASLRWRGPVRLVLNARRFDFDAADVRLPDSTGPSTGLSGSETAGGGSLGGGLGGGGGGGERGQVVDFRLAAALLRAALALRPEPSPEMRAFLDLAAALRVLPRLPRPTTLHAAAALVAGGTAGVGGVAEIDLAACELCFWVNLYHALLQHGLLLLGPPRTGREWAHFHSAVSYEVFGQVFSLLEIEHCVLRGGTPVAAHAHPGSASAASRDPSLSGRPLPSAATDSPGGSLGGPLSGPSGAPPASPAAAVAAPKRAALPKFYPPLPQADDERRAFSVSAWDPRANFVLNSGTLGGPCGPAVAVLEPATVQRQLNEATTRALEREVTADAARRVVTLPSAFDLFPLDFSAVPFVAKNATALRQRAADVVGFCLRHVGRDKWKQLSLLLMDSNPRPPVFHYAKMRFLSYDSLVEAP